MIIYCNSDNILDLKLALEIKLRIIETNYLLGIAFADFIS